MADTSRASVYVVNFQPYLSHNYASLLLVIILYSARTNICFLGSIGTYEYFSSNMQHIDVVGLC